MHQRDDTSVNDCQIHLYAHGTVFEFSHQVREIVSQHALNLEKTNETTFVLFLREMDYSNLSIGKCKYLGNCFFLFVTKYYSKFRVGWECSLKPAALSSLLVLGTFKIGPIKSSKFENKIDSLKKQSIITQASHQSD